MHIIQLTPYYAPAYPFGGVARAVEGLSRALVERGHRVTVITTDALSQTERISITDETRDGVRVLRCRNRSVWLRGRANLSTPIGMGAALRSVLAKADIIHTHEFRTAENLIALPIANRTGVPVVMSPHGTLTRTTGRSTLKSVWDALLSPMLAREIGGVVALTDNERDDVAALWERFGIDIKTFVIPNGVNPADFAILPNPQPFREQWGITAGRVMLYMGRLHPRKGAHLLAEAFIRAQLPDVHLILAGPDEGVLALLPNAVRTHPNITLTGYLDGDDRLAALAAADVFVLPARGEGLPVTALEAMAAGVPVVLSTGCYLPEVAAAGAGLVVDMESSPDALMNALHQIMSADHAPMSAAAKALVAARFDWAAVAVDMADVYRTVRGII